MEGIRQYIISVTAAAMICASLKHISMTTGKQGSMVKLLCGVFLLFTVIRPVADIRLDTAYEFSQELSFDSAAAIEAGQAYAAQWKEDIIKQQLCAYIMDKAADFEADIAPTAVLDENLMPAQIYIRGDISPYAKSRLQQIISRDLGIAKENLIWIR